MIMNMQYSLKTFCVLELVVGDSIFNIVYDRAVVLHLLHSLNGIIKDLGGFQVSHLQTTE